MEYVCELKRQGLTICQISELSGFDPKTVRKYLRDPDTPIYGPRAPRANILDPYKTFVDGELERGVWNVRVLHRSLMQRGYKGGYTSLKDYVHPRRLEANHVAVRRFETDPGRQAQVDWGDLGDVIAADGTQRASRDFCCAPGLRPYATEKSQAPEHQPTCATGKAQRKDQPNRNTTLPE